MSALFIKKLFSILPSVRNVSFSLAVHVYAHTKKTEIGTSMNIFQEKNVQKRKLLI